MPESGVPLTPESIGEALYLLRKRTSLGRAEVAERAEIPPSTYTRYESGTTRGGNYDVGTLDRILVVLADALSLDERRLWGVVLDIVQRERAEISILAAEVEEYRQPPNRRGRGQ
jgi:transcriptional regulator with XRE-family HTH domain